MTGAPAALARAQALDPDRPTVILLVDDEPLNLDLLEQELDGLSFEIRTAMNGQEALESIKERPPDMIFLDLMMPVMDGFEVLEILQQDELLRSIPVVIISAASDTENIVRAIEIGAVDFLPKPFNPSILQARLSAGLEKKRLHDLEVHYLQSLERELEIGRQIQADFLPAEIPQPDGWNIRAHFQAAREVAGDFYDVFEIRPEKLGVLLGDVTDKGVGSALYMALYRSLLRATLLADQLNDPDEEDECRAPEECMLQAVTLVNRYICKFHGSAMFATLFFAVLDTYTGQFCYVNAGHDAPYVLRDHQIIRIVKPSGPLVGAFETAEYSLETFILEPGDQLVLYSDGIPDAQNEVGEMFGAERLRALLQEARDNPQTCFDTVISEVNAHIGDAVQFDDITLMVVEREA
ncbi:MAG: fused response regulator/phosphatase [Anaerolineales bacterium]|jgi:serine phosphatase RsbU (regulator of sigma subunit)